MTSLGFVIALYYIAFRMSLKSASSESDSLDCIGHIIRKLRGDDPNAQEKINKGEPDEMVRKNISNYIFKNVVGRYICTI